MSDQERKAMYNKSFHAPPLQKKWKFQDNLYMYIHLYKHNLSFLTSVYSIQNQSVHAYLWSSSNLSTQFQLILMRVTSHCKGMWTLLTWNKTKSFYNMYMMVQCNSTKFSSVWFYKLKVFSFMTFCPKDTLSKVTKKKGKVYGTSSKATI